MGKRVGQLWLREVPFPSSTQLNSLLCRPSDFFRAWHCSKRPARSGNRRIFSQIRNDKPKLTITRHTLAVEEGCEAVTNITALHAAKLDLQIEYLPHLDTSKPLESQNTRPKLTLLMAGDNSSVSDSTTAGKTCSDQSHQLVCRLGTKLSNHFWWNGPAPRISLSGAVATNTCQSYTASLHQVYTMSLAASHSFWVDRIKPQLLIWL
jgi:hypothetical protein